MKKNRRMIIAVLLICITYSGITFAYSNTNIEVLFNYINIKINGEKVDLDNFIYENTTYVPLRKVSELLNKDVIWNDVTKTANIVENSNSSKAYYTEYDGFRNALITHINNNELDLEFIIKNITQEDITITLKYPYFDFAIYDENESEIYRHSKAYPIYATVIKDEKINSGDNFVVKEKIDLTDLNLVSCKIYKVVFDTDVEIKANKRYYKLREDAYFKIPE
ncbi:hypothetical protein HZI73_01205 [Vallitalea pronyensis]|uniref:Copper amine oxidase-like N-terminal domain-containing protein n=1 Tax=Vallitalea pronyensis TaxID=1348613 RepID=A0A8J8SEV4_9FIRM|nr:stalk domain-containing protein [Vallitalea pronyensis]QUI20996.1 hypothetical protein HZI73_01205 [Vallitalea pronyensis]